MTLPHISEMDLMWFVGLAEGECAIDAPRGYPRLRIGLTDRDLAGRAATLMGCHLRVTYHSPPRAAIWSAEIEGAKAAVLLELMLPHLGARRSAKAAEVLGAYRLARDTTGRKSMPGPRITRPPGFPAAVRETSHATVPVRQLEESPA